MHSPSPETSPTPPEDLIALGRTLGDPVYDLAILAEGNVSALLEDRTFWIKASGFTMREIGPDGFVQVHLDRVLTNLNGRDLDDDEVREALRHSRLKNEGPILPSVETFMHAGLFALPEVKVIGHTHPIPLLSLLCIEGAEKIAGQRLFPDEIVCCGPATAFVPYVDPGLPLARAVDRCVRKFIETHSQVPKTIWLQNHGLIALGKNRREVESATFMATKAARVWLGALSTGRTLTPLRQDQIDRIHTRPDEHYRQRLLWQIDSQKRDNP